jgi:hypothetical protein
VFNANNSNDVDHIANNNDIDHIANNDEDIDRIANHNNNIKSVDIILGPKLHRQREHTLNISSGNNSNLNCTSMSVPTETTIGANQTVQESNSSAITMPAAQSPEDNAALIGGIVGGAIALLLIGALIAFAWCAVGANRKTTMPARCTRFTRQAHLRKATTVGSASGPEFTFHNHTTYKHQNIHIAQ